MHQEFKRIVIVGGGTAGWMAAASLNNYLRGQSTQVTVIESSSIGTIGVGEATIPNIVQFNRNLGIDEIEFIKATKATFKLGIQFERWAVNCDSFFHPFADYGATIDNVEFHQYLNHMQANGHSVNLSDYSFPCVLANKGKFAQPHPNPQTPLADYAYAYHFDAGRYAEFLKHWCTSSGVEHIDGLISETKLRVDNGFIKSVRLEDGSEINADFFIDCSGFQGLLIEQALNTGYEDWSDYLLCDRAVAVQTTSVAEPEPYTRSIAHGNGWQWHIPLQHRTGNGYIYASRYQSQESAEAQLLDSIQGETINAPRHLRFTPGRRKKIWNKNCFALGLASGFLEPLESTSISLIQTALAKLLTFFPDSSFNQADIDEVNRLHNHEMENIRDFLILHYKLSGREDSDFWRTCRDMKIPATLQHKIDVFKSRGHIVMHENESFEKSSWLTMYNAFGVVPHRRDPRAELVATDLISNKLGQMSHSINGAASQAMSHQQFINKHCLAPQD
ncbi:MAG: tryptophan halogenase family protein [Psychrobium sp.]